MSAQPTALPTVDRYLEIERAAEFRSEYLDGEIYAMAGGGRNHALIAAAAIARLDAQLRGRPCAVAGSDLRVFCRPANVMTYPDVVVFCEPASFLDGEKDSLTDATVIIEVLSRSTQRYGRGEKFHYYRGLSSFSEYLLPSQNAIRAEHYVRQEDGSWNLRELSGADTDIHFNSIGCTLRLGSLYERVDFAPA